MADWSDWISLVSVPVTVRKLRFSSSSRSAVCRRSVISAVALQRRPRPTRIGKRNSAASPSRTGSGTNADAAIDAGTTVRDHDCVASGLFHQIQGARLGVASPAADRRLYHTDRLDRNPEVQQANIARKLTRPDPRETAALRRREPGVTSIAGVEVGHRARHAQQTMVRPGARDAASRRPRAPATARRSSRRNRRRAAGLRASRAFSLSPLALGLTVARGEHAAPDVGTGFAGRRHARDRTPARQRRARPDRCGLCSGPDSRLA